MGVEREVVRSTSTKFLGEDAAEKSLPPHLNKPTKYDAELRRRQLNPIIQPSVSDSGIKRPSCWNSTYGVPALDFHPLMQSVSPQSPISPLHYPAVNGRSSHPVTRSCRQSVTSVLPRFARSMSLMESTGKLPLLRDENAFVSGFSGIVDYLKKKVEFTVDLDTALSPIQRAESKAFSALILSRGSPVVDYNLYIDSRNYSEATRPLVAGLLNFPARYTYPLSLRKAAVARSGAFYSISLGEDIPGDNLHSKDNAIEAVDLTATSTLMPNTSTPGLLLNLPEKRAGFKLEQLCHRFLEPLAKRLTRTFLVSEDEDRPSEADCLALAYLSLCLVPELPNNITASIMKEKYPRLCGWVHNLRGQVFGPTIEAAAVIGLKEDQIIPEGTRGALLWGASETGDWLWLSKFLYTSVKNTIIGENDKTLERLKAEREANETPFEKENRLRGEALKRRRRRINYALAAGAAISWLVYVAMTHFTVEFVDNVDEGDDEEDDEEEEEADESEPLPYSEEDIDDSDIQEYLFAQDHDED